MKNTSQGELQALISLLDDSDPEVFNHVEEKLCTIGKEAIPVLEEVWSKSFDTLIQNRIENIVHQIQLDSLKHDLKKWSEKSDAGLLEGVILIARYQYPDLDAKKIKKQITEISNKIKIKLKEQLSPQDKIKAINHVLYDVYGFNGNTANFHAPQNSFINAVLETRKANPLMLCVVYSLVANKLGIPVYGVNLPEHFILAYCEKNETPGTNILFYINAFSRGSVFTKKDVDQFLKKLNLQPAKIFYEPCSNLEIILRSLRNLSFAFNKLGDTEKINEIETLIDSINP